MYVQRFKAPAQTCPVDLDSAASDQQKFQRIRQALECELGLRFGTSTSPGVLERRQRLSGLFKRVPLGFTSKLQRELEEARTTLAKLFWGRLHPVTCKELLRSLCLPFFKEYELRFNPTADTFSVDNNPTMTAAQKILRKRDVNGLIGDAVSSPGILWRRLLARVDAALDPSAGLPSFPPPKQAVKDAVRRLSDAQVALFREAFPNGSGGIDFGTFQSCFERFANGELRDPSVPGHVGFGEPNGGNYFLFAEFAFLCVDLKFAESVWTEALRTFVKTQEIFMHVYRERPTSPPPSVSAPVPAAGLERRDVLSLANPADPGFDFTHFRPIGGSVSVGQSQSDLSRKMALRAKYDAMDVNALKIAARDNLRRALRMPYSMRLPMQQSFGGVG